MTRRNNTTLKKAETYPSVKNIAEFHKMKPHEVQKLKTGRDGKGKDLVKYNKLKNKFVDYVKKKIK